MKETAHLQEKLENSKMVILQFISDKKFLFFTDFFYSTIKILLNIFAS